MEIAKDEEYTRSCRVHKVMIRSNGLPEFDVMEYHYNDKGDIILMLNDISSYRFHYQYNEDGKILYVKRNYQYKSDHEKNVVEYWREYDDRGNLISYKTDSTVTRNSYDSNNNLISYTISKPIGGDEFLIIEQGKSIYDMKGNMVESVISQEDDIIRAELRKYDDRNNLIRSIKYWSDIDQNTTTIYSYDEHDRLIYHKDTFKDNINERWIEYDVNNNIVYEKCTDWIDDIVETWIEYNDMYSYARSSNGCMKWIEYLD